MCGIFCVFNTFCNNCDNLINQLTFEANIRNRGPDSFNFKVLTWKDTSLAFASSVLWLQGNKITVQPIEDSDSIFCYNGDIFAGFDVSEQKLSGDTQLIHQFIKKHISRNSLSNLDKVQGPYAFIYFDKTSNKLYFGRDIFGRRSLLLGQNKERDTFIITSVAKRQSQFDFIEIPSVGIFCYDIENGKFEVDFWQYKNHHFYGKLKELEKFLSTDVSIINQPVESECETHCFSENANLKALLGIEDMVKSKDYNGESTAIFDTLLNCDTWMEQVKCLKRLLEKAISQRISAQPDFCKNCIKSKSFCTHSTTGILFSGGVDCAVLAALTDQYVDKNKPIDLLNVSFDEGNHYESPDRLTGLQTFEELKSQYPGRKWNFVPVNVTKASLNEDRERHIADLIYPLNTIMDDSLGCALWYASRGVAESYTSPCRILIVGMGADELFGGYSRHRTSFKRYSWKGLQEVLDEDWMNLPYRNLGRDDRVVSDHGRQLRTPYLDERVVEFVRGLKCWEKTYPSENLPQGVGEKILLRSLAYHLGLKGAAVLKKRALQFGSRIANGKENAHEVSPRLAF
ncbi:asparagine synthetase domain-containing protein 1 [Anthonomus grandis grandis]|uniref:asparagine synthetase domain-containing protein 1 n=1 Tax=Anthonomus grandis grandis TaxID=2921223 RepID=UPI00216524ED|nr:asparagine synthetase domain-containing protein 1 [Anthonomus grandis grandis]